MIFPEKIESKIGFDGVREQVSARCRCAGAKSFCEEMSFLSDYTAVKAALSETAEMYSANHSEEAIPFSGLNDIDSSLSLVR
ncbi:MAG: hypothetical protein K2F68_00320, partial [Duncaniella sp.]|nr:hypothetical protein [Duncaniella sp.]